MRDASIFTSNDKVVIALNGCCVPLLGYEMCDNHAANIPVTTCVRKPLFINKKM